MKRIVEGISLNGRKRKGRKVLIVMKHESDLVG